MAADDARLRRHLVAALRDAGHEVDDTGDGLKALRLLERHEDDAAVLDITMPGMDGVSAIRKARGHGCRAVMLLSTARGEVRGELRDKVAGTGDGFRATIRFKTREIPLLSPQMVNEYRT